jgi:hypothetical protein
MDAPGMDAPGMNAPATAVDRGSKAAGTRPSECTRREEKHTVAIGSQW